MRSLANVVLCCALSCFSSVLVPLFAQSQPGKLSTKVVQRPTRRYAVTRGAWSAATVSLFNTWGAFDENAGRHAIIPSPDHTKSIEVLGNHVVLRIGNRTFKTGIDSVMNVGAELGWAPDSSKYFLTWSETGELGPWHMQVYGVDDAGVHEFPKVSDPARNDFEQRVRRMPIDPEMNTPELRVFWNQDEYCEPYHVIGGRWLNESREILLSVLIRNTGDCRYSSDFNVYRVNATTGEMLERFTAVKAHKLYGSKYLPIITR